MKRARSVPNFSAVLLRVPQSTEARSPGSCLSSIVPGHSLKRGSHVIVSRIVSGIVPRCLLARAELVWSGAVPLLCLGLAVRHAPGPRRGLGRGV